MASTIDHADPSDALDLAVIRAELIRLEDTITFALIERVQFPLNRTVYDPNGIDLPTKNTTLLDWILWQTEHTHSLIRRFESPDEHPFFPGAVAQPLLKPLEYPLVLYPNDVNVNDQIKTAYIEKVLPTACKHWTRADRGQHQENYGSTVVADVSCLQALSRRIHYGKFVAESKFQKETERFVALIVAEDRAGIDLAITNAKVEAQVLERLELKAKTYGTDPSDPSPDQAKINVDAVVAMYKEIVIPLTKIVEVEYLMQRLKGTKWEPPQSKEA